MSIRSKPEWQQMVRANVEQHGWFCQHVFDPDGNDPHFAYTTGFTKTLSSPEFIIFGLNNELHHAMLWEIFHQIKKGKIVSHGQKWEGLLGGDFVCYGFKCTHEDLFEEYALSSKWFWNDQGHTGDPEVYQIVWPGAQGGLFPWDQGCDPQVISSQPQLYLK